MKYVLALVVSALVVSLSSAQSTSPDESAAVLQARWQRAMLSGQQPSTAGPSGNSLFHHVGGDNAACVRGLPDVNGDGKDAVLAGFDLFQSNDNFYCLDGASSGAATVLWSLETSGGVSGGYFFGEQCLSLAADVTGDGQSEVLAGLAGGGRFAAAYNGATGALVWQYDTYLNPPSGWVYSVQEVGDINGDQVSEVFFGTGSDHDSVHMIDGTSTGTSPTVLWSHLGGDAFYSVAAMGDVNNDTRPDVLAGNGDNVDDLTCFDGTDGTVLWCTQTGGSNWHVNSIEDLTGDGIREAMAATWDSTTSVTCVNGASGAVLWTASVGTFAMKVVPIEDVDGDHLEDILVASWDNSLRCLSSSNGAQIWSASAGTLNGGDVWTAAVLEDVNGDCQDDAVFGSFDGSVYVVDGQTGTQLWSHATGNRVFSVAEVGDLNADGAHEVVAGTQDTTNLTVVHAVEGDSQFAAPQSLSLIGTPSLGASVTLHIVAPAGDLVLLMLALADGCLPFPPLGTLQLDPASTLYLGSLLVPPAGEIFLPGTLPADAATVGLTPHIQCPVIHSVGPLTGAVTNRLRFSILP